MKSSDNGLIVVIPSYEPTEAFVDYAKEISRYAKRVIVVNDGSGADYDEIFGRIAAIENVSYVTYGVNRGKGYAIRTALQLCMAEFSDGEVIVTADCDGQHTVFDVLKVYRAVKSRGDQLVLGSRSFSAKHIPWRSRIGNAMIRNIYRLFYGLSLYDTQTGLRGFPLSLAKELEQVKGDRFEYEMNVLIYAKKQGIAIAEIPIQTVYPEDPKDHVTHYKPIRDSLRILGVVLQNFNLYLLSGLLAGLLDIIVFHLLTSVVFSGISPLYTLIATVTARVLSSVLNFILNFKYVFRGASARAILRYYVLWFCQLGASYGIAFLFGNLIGLHLTPVKLVGDLLLSIISYQIQCRWVFGKRDPHRFYGGFSRFVRFFARIFIGKYEASVTPYGEPAVYVCRHLDLHGPITSLVWLPFDVHPLVFSPFFDESDCYHQYATYTFTARKGRSPKKRSVKAYLASRVVPPLVHSVGAVPVYRTPSRGMQTMKIGLAHLLCGESLIVYPDMEYTAGGDTESAIYDGFLYLGQMYWRKTGKSLRFVPIYIDEDCRVIREGECVTVDHYRRDRANAVEELRAAINGREQTCVIR